MALSAISPSGVSTAWQYPAQPNISSGGYTGAITATPPSINPPIIFEPDCSFTGDQLKVIMIVTALPLNWGGAQVWGSIDGTTYGQLGVVYKGGTQGLLTATFPSGSDPDTVNTLSVDVSESGQQVVAGSTQDADFGLTLAYVDGELVGYSAVTLTAPSMYNLGTYLRRGMFNSTIASHASGTQFGLINGNDFSQTYLPNLVGQTVYFKFPSFNTAGGNLQPLASVVPYTYTLTGAGLCTGTKVKCRTLTTGASTTLSLTGDYLVNIAKTVGSPTTVNGPALPVPDGARFEIADLGNSGLGDSDTNPITFQPAGGILVAGLSDYVFMARGGAFVVTYCASSNQWTIS